MNKSKSSASGSSQILRIVSVRVTTNATKADSDGVATIFVKEAGFVDLEDDPKQKCFVIAKSTKLGQFELTGLGRELSNADWEILFRLEEKAKKTIAPLPQLTAKSVEADDEDTIVIAPPSSVDVATGPAVDKTTQAREILGRIGAPATAMIASPALLKALAKPGWLVIDDSKAKELIDLVIRLVSEAKKGPEHHIRDSGSRIAIDSRKLLHFLLKDKIRLRSTLIARIMNLYNQSVIYGPADHGVELYRVDEEFRNQVDSILANKEIRRLMGLKEEVAKDLAEENGSAALAAKEV